MTTLLQTQEQTEYESYVRARDTFSYHRLRKEVGVSNAIRFERRYQGECALEIQSTEALAQVNDILRALRRPTITEWPKEPIGICDVCGAKVPQSHIKDQSYLSRDEVVDGPSCCRACRRAEDVEASDWSPLDEIFGRIYDATDFYYWIPASNTVALEVSADCPGCDLINLRNDQPMTINEAQQAVENDIALKLGLGFQETLNGFIGDVFRDLYPELCGDGKEA